MVRLLENGFYAYPESDYFFITLVKHYNDQGDYDKALPKILKMTELQPNHRDHWYMAGKEQMLLGDDDSALISFSRCIQLKADDAESYSAMGNIYLHKAHEAYAQFNTPLSDPTYAERKTAVTQLYQQACNAFEQARLFDQLHPDLWLSGLREAYFKLNKGKELRVLEGAAKKK
jgi:tetratricopeptide (TPR) repeat protein